MKCNDAARQKNEMPCTMLPSAATRMNTNNLVSSPLRTTRHGKQLLFLFAVLFCVGKVLVAAQGEAKAQEGIRKGNISNQEFVKKAREEYGVIPQAMQVSKENIKEEKIKGELEPEREGSRRSDLSQDQYGVWNLKNSDSFAQVLKNKEENHPHGILLVLLYSYSESCQADQDPWISRLEKASEYVWAQVISEDIHFGRLNTDQWEGAADWLAGIGVESTPTLVFIVARNFHQKDNKGSHVFLLDYIGPLGSAVDIGNTFLQYYTRLFLTTTTPTTFRPFPNLPDDFAAQIVPRQFADMDQIKEFWLSAVSDLSWKIASSALSKPGSISKHWSQHDRRFIWWLMNGADSSSNADSDENTEQPSITMFIQCQATSHEVLELVDFAEIGWILSSRRDVWFVGLSRNCPDEIMNPGQVGAYRFDRANQEAGWDYPVAVSSREDDMGRFIIHHSTPAALWFDRYATGPIAFADNYKVHFLLLINLHPLENEVERYAKDLQSVVQDFHKLCDEIKGDPNNNNSICLIVPSTEIRVLTTFGIDLWSPLDDRATREEVPHPSFPALLITDRRQKRKKYRDGSTTTNHAVLRYLLRSTEILEEDAVNQFTRHFWNHQLLPEVRSTPWQEGDVQVNKFGVTTLNAAAFQNRFQSMPTTEEHALVLFTQPSCGHCKRFHNIYNEASRIIRGLKWDQHMAMYRVEISRSNEVHGIPLAWLPDIYYFPPNLRPEREEDPPHSQSIKPVQYNISDQFGNRVGQLGNPLDLIEWWLDAMLAEDNWMHLDPLLKSLKQKYEGPTEEEV